MSRFLLSLDDAVDTIFFAVNEAKSGELIIPKPSSALIEDVADVMIGNRSIDKQNIIPLNKSSGYPDRELKDEAYIEIKLVGEKYTPKRFESRGALSNELRSTDFFVFKFP